jgi:hypothetical protein
MIKTIFIPILRELVGMFIDDDDFAMALLGIVALASALAYALAAPSVVVGGVLLLATLVVLIESVLRASRKR